MFKKTLLLMAFFLAIFGVARAQSELTVYDGTVTNNVVPAYMFYFDDFTRVQHVIPADDLAEMRGKSITSLKYYTTASNVPYTAVSAAQVYLMEVDYTTMTALEPLGSGTVVFEGYFDVVSEGDGGSLTIEFDTPYAYGGGNLLIGIDNTEDYGYKSIYFYGQTVTGAGWGGSNGTSLEGVTGSTRNFIPKTTFTYVGSGPTCEKPATIDVDGITGYEATCTWESNVGNYTFEWKKASETDWNVVPNLTTNTYSLSSLEPMTAYNVRVKAVCGTDLESGYRTANFTTLDVCPDGKVCIGEGTATNSYLPTYNFYNYSLTQQIYTAEELGEAAAILSVDIYSVGSVTRNLEIYMVSTEKAAFEDGDDWIPVSSGDLVFSHEVAFAANSWNTMVFDNEFAYDGRSNVALIVRDMTGSYNTSISFFVFDATAQAIRAYRDASAYDITDPGVTGTVLNVKNRVRFAMGEPPACPKPSAVTVNYVSGTTAEVTWNSDAASFNIDVNGTVTNNVTSPYTLQNLALGTDYEVMVQANCGGGELSEWTSPVSFTTDACMPEDMTIVNYALADSYGDGWNGNYILVLDETCNIVEELTIESGNSATGTIKVCGAYVQFVWYKGNYPGETSWSFTNAAGEVLFEGTGNTSMATGDVLYTIDNNPYPAPTDIDVAEVGPHSAKLSWTENGTATAWEIMLDEDEDHLIQANSNPFVITGLDPETDYYVQVRAKGTSGTSMWPCIGISFTTTEPCPVPNDLTATSVTYQSAHLSWTGFGETYDLRYMPVGGSGTKSVVESNTSAKRMNNNQLKRVETQLKANPAAQPKACANARQMRDGWYYYDDGTYKGGIGTGSATDVYWAIMLPAGMTNNTQLTKISVFEVSSYNTETITLYVCTGDDTPNLESPLYTQEFEPEAADAFHEVTLTTPVDYNCLSNLWIVLKENGTYPASGSNNTGDPNGRWISLDGTSWADAYADYSLEYTWMIRAYCEGEVVLPWINVTGINAAEYDLTGLEAETEYTVQVRSNCGDDGTSDWSSVQFTTGSMCDVPNELAVTDLAATSATLNWNSGLTNFNVKYREVPHGEVLESQNFDDSSMGSWTTIDADGDGYDWVLGSACGGVYLVEGGSLAGTGHNSSADLIVSGSYSNMSGVGALTPDNYLVSPQVTLGGIITFWACGQDASYPAEHFGVAVSTTSNTDPTTFTTIAEWTLTASGTGAKAQGTWGKFTVDLSAYSGQGYVAIRHFDCTDQFMLDVDDITIEAALPTIEWTTATTTTTSLAISGLTPETEYEWQVQGINKSCDGGATEWTEIQTFTTPEQTTVTQTIALAAGSNYVSYYVETTLANLKAALVEAFPGTAIVIKSKNQTTTYDPARNRWNGTFNTFDVGRMNIIKVAQDGEITLQGDPVDPSAHPVTIVNGTNYISFPLNVNMTPTNAFAGFAVNGDKLKSKNATCPYTTRWGRQIPNLEPGQGYIYQGAATQERTLIFPNAK